MKVIFVASLSNPSSSGIQRMWALQQCGAIVYKIDKDKYFSKKIPAFPFINKLISYAGKVLKSPKLFYNISNLPADIIKLSEQVKPDIVWFEWPQEIQISLLKQLKELQKAPYLISFQDDNPWGSRAKDKWMWKDYFKAVPEFDMHLVKRQDDITQLTALGAKKCRIWLHGIYSPLFHPAKLPTKYPVSFVGTCMDNRAALMEYLLENKIPLHVFGNKWSQRSDLPKKFPHNFHPAVEGEAYAEVIRSSMVCLGLVSHSNKDEWTMRTYEVPSCAAVLLAEKTPFHEHFFAEDSNTLLFSTKEECLSQLLYLLKNQDLCKQLGEKYYQKLLANNCTLEAQMKNLLTDLKFNFN